ncbi:MAG: hypothetical protein HWN67_04715 [Candidatus Helarchaeota archaeon]|nr:hypothetical protein [Candidatus Helarchaeota archaeon]
MGLKRKLMDWMMPKEFGAISGLFHAGVFTLQSNIVKTLGDIGYKDYVFPSIKESIEKIADIGLEPIVGENIEDFGKRFIKILKKSLLVTNADLQKKSENEYTFTLEKCFMAKSAHQIAGTKGVCPMAMVVATMIEKYTRKQIILGYSTLTPTGSSTKITIT